MTTCEVAGIDIAAVHAYHIFASSSGPAYRQQVYNFQMLRTPRGQIVKINAGDKVVYIHNMDRKCEEYRNKCNILFPPPQQRISSNTSWDSDFLGYVRLITCLTKKEDKDIQVTIKNNLMSKLPLTLEQLIKNQQIKNEIQKK